MPPPSKGPVRRPLPLRPPEFYPGVECCIYCLRTGVPLSDEHIIPLGWAGNSVMRKASCSDCAALTSRIERKILRDFWGPAREALNFPTRRPKRRANTLSLPIDDGVTRQTLILPWHDYPAQIALFQLEKPGLLGGKEPSPSFTVLGTWIASLGNNEAVPGQFAEIEEFGYFTRFIAKIAHAFAFAQLGVEAFTYWQFLPRVIDETYPHPAFIVGGSGAKAAEQQNISTTFATSFRFVTWIVAELEFLVVQVQLFSDIDGPVYLAVFGGRPSKTGVPTIYDLREPTSDL